MMRIGKLSFRSICLIVGIVLILLSMSLLIFWQSRIKRNAEALSVYVQTLEELIPEVQSAVVEPRVNNAMPSLNVYGNNFIAILELPANDASLPVGASWSDMDAYPCLYTGSAYDGSLIVGTSNQKGQFDFVKEISVGNAVYVTDMTGNQFSYKVTDIQYCDHADNQTLSSESDDLTIFVKNIYAFEYIIIRCSALGS